MTDDVCIFCADKKRIRGEVKYLVWSARDDGTSVTQGDKGVASMRGGSIPCPACDQSAYGPIVSVEIIRE